MKLHLAAGLLVALLLSACLPENSPDASPSPSASATALPTESGTPLPPTSASATTEATPSPTAEPSLALDLPPNTDPRVAAVSVAVEVPADGDGRIVVTVTSQADALIDELVLRWATDLDEVLFLAPFTPSDERIAEGGPPLTQPWTKWVIGPGEQDEPAGTTSLGWGPLLPGATLEIPIVVSRTGAGPVAFDLQVLAGNDILSLSSGDPAVLRVEVP